MVQSLSITSEMSSTDNMDFEMGGSTRGARRRIGRNLKLEDRKMLATVTRVARVETRRKNRRLP